jgi:hypothetical protein
MPVSDESTFVAELMEEAEPVAAAMEMDEPEDAPEPEAVAPESQEPPAAPESPAPEEGHSHADA